MTSDATTEWIEIHGARVHNLRNLDVAIPRDRLVVFTGVSGSGKSSLAFDTLFAEGQRRYLESLSTYTRQFLDQLERPDVDLIEGLPPTLSIEQRVGSVQLRSTLATTTELYDYLRLLYARAGQAHCPNCGRPVSQQTRQAIVEQMLGLGESRKVMILAPLVRGRKGLHREVFERIVKEGFVRARVDGEVIEATAPPKLVRTKPHDIEAIIDRIVIKAGIRPRLEESVDVALRLGEGACLISYQDGDGWHDRLFSSRFACLPCGLSFPDLEPRTFSFNSPYGACPKCQGLGVLVESDAVETDAPHAPQPICPECQGARLGPFARAVTIVGKAIHELTALSVEDAFRFLTTLMHEIQSDDAGSAMANRSDDSPPYEGGAGGGTSEAKDSRCGQAPAETQDEKAREALHATPPAPLFVRGGVDAQSPLPGITVAGLSPERVLAARTVLPELLSRLRFLRQVGLEYLTLDRPTRTLSGGEFQRARLAACLGSGLVGVCYILDEPTIGLHACDTERLIRTLEELREQGNTVLVVEHDLDLIRRADYVLDLGPGAGREGGRLIAAGTPQVIAANPASITGQYLQRLLPAFPSSAWERTSRSSASRAGSRASGDSRSQAELGNEDAERVLTLHKAHLHNLKSVTVEIPLGRLVCVTGVSGSGKSSLIMQTLVPAVAQALATQVAPTGPFESLAGIERIHRLVEVDQAPLGRTGRSNPATYSGIWDEVRKVFAQTREARIRGFTSRRFSFNAKEGRCPECAGQGTKRIEMNFLPDLYVTCPVCRGARFNRQTLAIRYRGRNVADVLEMRIDEAAEFFSNFPKLHALLTTFVEVGLGYLTLGQSSPTLSGGEAQRVKLATELSRSAGEKHTLFVLDEPTTGLHPADIDRLLGVLRRLVAQDNTVLVVEHQLEVIAAADWVIDLGPGGGAAGGQIIAAGPPRELARHPTSRTAAALRRQCGSTV